MFLLFKNAQEHLKEELKSFILHPIKKYYTASFLIFSQRVVKIGKIVKIRKLIPGSFLKLVIV
jgi:hypothetical protein